MATKKKSGNLVQLLRIAFDEVNKKFEGKNIEFKIQNSYNHDDVCMDSFNENQEYFCDGCLQFRPFAGRR